MTCATWSAVGANCARYWPAEMNCPYCGLDGSLTAVARASSPAASRGASQTFALMPPVAAGTAFVADAAAVHAGLVSASTARPGPSPCAVAATRRAEHGHASRHQRQSAQPEPTHLAPFNSRCKLIPLAGHGAGARPTFAISRRERPPTEGSRGCRFLLQPPACAVSAPVAQGRSEYANRNPQRDVPLHRPRAGVLHELDARARESFRRRPSSRRARREPSTWRSACRSGRSCGAAA